MNRLIPYTTGQIKEFRHYKGEVTQYSVNYTRLESETGESVSSVSWSTEDNATINNEAFASKVATADITTNTEGWQLIKVTATLPSTTSVFYFKIKVLDPVTNSQDYN